MFVFYLSVVIYFSVMHSSKQIFHCRTPRRNSCTTLCGYVRKFVINLLNNFIDLNRIIRLLDTSSSSTNQNVVHKIRIQYFDRRKPQDLLGKRDITCTILSYKPSEQNFDDEITNPPSSRMRTGTTNSSPNVPQQETRKLLKNKLFQSIIFFFLFIRRSIIYFYFDHSWCHICIYTYFTNNTR